MNLPTLLRTLTADPAADADLLARFRAGRDGAAFAELVRRHGRLVWAACRHQTRCAADADDAFQAVWLALARTPAAVRHPERLPAWLHAVAGRVCGKLRRADARRLVRERAAAGDEVERAVPAAAWDRALAALHEEVARLPEGERVAFVLCGLEGVGVTEAAARLGWKLGTLSGRLTRAKARLADRLSARDLAVGAVAAVASVGPVPAAVAGKAAGWAAGAVASRTILTLSQGAVMGVNRVKLLAAGLLLAGGLGAGVGGGWLATAQEPAAAKPAEATAEVHINVGPSPAKSSKWEFHYHPLLADQYLTPAEFEAIFAGYEADGWGFASTVPIKAANGQKTPNLVFYRAKPSDAASLILNSGTLTLSRLDLPAADDVAALKARIADLERELVAARDRVIATGRLLPQPAPAPGMAAGVTRVPKNLMPLHDLREAAKLITALTPARPGNPAGPPVPPIGVTVSGEWVLITADAAGRDWLLGVLKAIAPPTPSSPTTPGK